MPELLPSSIVVTGCGLVSPAGVGVDALRTSLRERRVHLGMLPATDRNPVAEGAVLPADFVAAHADYGRAACRLALREALDDAGFAVPPGRSALLLGTALGGIETGAPEELESPHRWTSELASQVGIASARTFSATCVSAFYALEQACFDLELGRAEVAVVGGFDTLSPFMRAGFGTLGALAAESADGSPPDGLLLSEGACFVVLETAAAAAGRGARARASVAGRGCCADAIHLTAPDESGRGMSRAIRDCLAAANCRPADVDRISTTADRSSRYARMYDSVVADVFGAGGVERVTWEESIGHVLAATGALGLLHATLMFERAAGNELALTVGFGGQNGATLLLSPNRGAA